MAGTPWRAAGRFDNSAAQLATARKLQQRFGLRFPLIQASGEQAPFAGGTFDLAISEYGASIWCDIPTSGSPRLRGCSVPVGS